MRYAFSLVELSIVLVILGLLTGGILGGQALIRAAELRSISNDFNRYVTAAHTFRDKYFALPGDMRNATKFWGAQTGSTNEGVDAACAALNSSSPATGTPTCNGDGNGQISNDDFGAGNNASWFEVWRAWQHLANAGLVEGTYSGVTAATGQYYIGEAGLNMPRSKARNGAGFAFAYLAYQSTATSWVYPGTQGNLLRFGGGDRVDQGSLISAEEAWNVDTKMDDGRPGTGKLRPYLSSRRTGCSTADDPNTSTYNFTSTSINACNLMFMSGI